MNSPDKQTVFNANKKVNPTSQVSPNQNYEKNSSVKGVKSEQNRPVNCLLHACLCM